MKRYQCIKTVIVRNFGYPSIEHTVFKSGNVYPELSNLDDDWTELVDDLGNAHIITPQLLENFKEVTTIENPQPKKRVGLGCAILIAIIITVLALIFFR